MNGVGVLIELAKALGLGKSGKDVAYGSGDLDWGWVVDPVGNGVRSLNGDGRDNVLVALKDLLGLAGSTGTRRGTESWYPVGPMHLVLDPPCDERPWTDSQGSPTIETPMGSASDDIVRAGLGVKVGSDPICRTRCWLLGLGGDGPHLPGGDTIGPEIEVSVEASTVLGLKGLTGRYGFNNKKQLQLTDFNNTTCPPDPKPQTTPPADPDSIDPIELALFAIKSFLRWQASKGEEWATRVVDHLFVAFGSRTDPSYGVPVNGVVPKKTEHANPVPPFPKLFDSEWPSTDTPGELNGPSIGKWLLALLPEANFTDLNADAAATFLLQLVWAITGKVPNISTGSRVVSELTESGDRGKPILRLSGDNGHVTLSAHQTEKWCPILSASSEGVTWDWEGGTWQLGDSNLSLALGADGGALTVKLSGASPLGFTEVKLSYTCSNNTFSLSPSIDDLVNRVDDALKSHLGLPTTLLNDGTAEIFRFLVDQIPHELDFGGPTGGEGRLARNEQDGSFTVALNLKQPDGPVFDQGGFSLMGAKLSLSGIRLEHLQFPAGGLSLVGLCLPFDQASGGTALGSALLPESDDSRSGIDLDIAWGAGFDNPGVTGTKVIAVQQQIGPVDLDHIVVAMNTAQQRLDVEFDLSLEIAGIGVHPQGLYVCLRLPNDAQESFLDCIEPRLQGLGVTFETAGMSARGMFVEHTHADGRIDYQGAAQLSLAGVNVDGVGAFSQDGGTTSIFVFAGVNAALGGTPDFFLTGLAGGFGYNRALKFPSLNRIDQHPFLQVLNGDLDIAALSGAIDTYLPVATHDSWFAAGLTFRTYGVIAGSGLLAVQVGSEPKISFFGSAGLDIPPLLNLELALQTEVSLGDNPYLYVAMGLTSKSTILFDLIKPHGQGAYKQWFDQGYAVLTIGGYDKDFHPPKASDPDNAWPDADRIGFHAGWGPLSIDVDGYIAVLPKEIQFGLDVEGSLDFGWVGLSAWIRSATTVSWDPVYFETRLSIGISLWVDTFAYSDSWDLGIDMGVWGPPFGGYLEIDVVVDTLEIHVGKKRKSAPLPSVKKVVEQQLGLACVPAESITIPAVTKGDQKGVFHLDVLFGAMPQETEVEKGSYKVQKDLGILRVQPEFKLRLDSALPSTSLSLNKDSIQVDAVSLAIVPCERAGLISVLSVKPTSTTAGGSFDSKSVRAQPRIATFPAALFAANGVNLSADGQTIKLVRGLELDATIDPTPMKTSSATLTHEVSEVNRELPLGTRRAVPVAAIAGLLPADAPTRQSWRRPATEGAPVTPKRSIQTLALRGVPPLSDPAPRGLPGSSSNTRWPKRLPPAPTARGAALAGLSHVRLQTAPVTSALTGTVDRRLLRQSSTIPTLEGQLHATGLKLPATRALLLEASGDGLALHGTGDQQLRLLSLGSDDRMLQDMNLQPGAWTFKLPVDARRVLAVGLGTPDPRRSATISAGFTATTPLIRLGRRGWAAPAAVLILRHDLPPPILVEDKSTAFDILAGANEVEMWFSALNGAIAVIVHGGVPGLRAAGATLDQPQTVATPNGSALLYAVSAAARWRVAISIPAGASLVSVLTRSGDTATLASRLQAGIPILEDPVQARVGTTTLSVEQS